MITIVEKTELKARSLQFEAKAYSAEECLMSSYGATPALAEEKLKSQARELFNDLSEFLYPKASDIALRMSVEDLITEGADFDYNDNVILIDNDLIDAVINKVRSQIKGK